MGVRTNSQNSSTNAKYKSNLRLDFAPGKRGIPRQSWILDSTPWIPDSKYWIPDFLSVELGFWIPIVSRIPDSVSCIPVSEAQESGFQR